MEDQERTRMTAKEYLQGMSREIHGLDREIQRWVDREARLRSRMMNVTAPMREVPGPPPGGHGADLAGQIHDLQVLKARIDERIDRMAALQLELSKVIERVPDADYRELLELRYIDRLSWSEIGRRMGYERETVCRKHGRALRCIQIPRENPESGHTESHFSVL